MPKKKAVKKAKRSGVTAGRRARSKPATSPGFGGIGSDAVKKATGRNWDQWCRLLDKGGAAKLSHKQIAELVSEKHGVGDWWSQMVTVGYEQARGLRVKHQTASGFNASVSRTMPVSTAAAFKALRDDRIRAKWLPEPLTITTATPNKSVRIAWPDGTRVAVGISDKTGKSGGPKAQLAFQHEKLKDARAVARSKEFWKAKCAALAQLLSE